MTFPNFNTIKMQWAWGIMPLDYLDTYVQISTITADQYKELSGKDYQVPTAS